MKAWVTGGGNDRDLVPKSECSFRKKQNSAPPTPDVSPLTPRLPTKAALMTSKPCFAKGKLKSLFKPKLEGWTRPFRTIAFKLNLKKSLKVCPSVLKS